MTGFSCKDFSKLSNTFAPKDRRAILQKVLGPGGHTFKGVRDHVERARPLVLILENVDFGDKDEHNRCEDEPNLGFLYQTLSDIGCVVAHRKFQTNHYGLPQKRQRMYFVGLLFGDLGMSAEQGRSLLNDIFTCAHDLRIEQRPLEDFLLSPDHHYLAEEEQRSIAMARGSFAGDNAVWRSHHKESSICSSITPIHHLSFGDQ